MASIKSLTTGVTLLCLFVCSGCSTMEPMDRGMSREEVAASLEPGDKVAIYTKDSEEHVVVIKTITPDYIEGIEDYGDETYKQDDIIEIRKNEFDLLKTIAFGVMSLNILRAVGYELFVKPFGD